MVNRRRDVYLFRVICMASCHRLFFIHTHIFTPPNFDWIQENTYILVHISYFHESDSPNFVIQYKNMKLEQFWSNIQAERFSLGSISKHHYLFVKVQHAISRLPVFRNCRFVASENIIGNCHGIRAKFSLISPNLFQLSRARHLTVVTEIICAK